MRKKWQHAIITSLMVIINGCALSPEPITPQEEIYNAVIKNDFEKVDVILATGADINDAQVYDLWFYISLASGWQRVESPITPEIIQKLIDRGLDPYHKFGLISMTHHFAEQGRADLVKIVLENTDLSINEPGFTFGPPLTQAAHRGKIDAVKQLIKMGADTSFVDSQGRNFKQILVEHKQWKEEWKRKQDEKYGRSDSEDDWFTKLLVVGAVAAVTSTSGISTENKIDVISATTADVIGETGGKNLRSLHQQTNQSAEANQVVNSTTVDNAPSSNQHISYAKDKSTRSSSSRNSAALSRYEAEKQNCLNAGKTWRANGGCNYANDVNIQGWTQGNRATAQRSSDQTNQAGGGYSSFQSSSSTGSSSSSNSEATSGDTSYSGAQTTKKSIKAEAYCWTTKSGRYMCDGPGQKLQTSYATMEKAQDMVDCRNSTHLGNNWYDCNRILKSSERDARELRK